MPQSPPGTEASPPLGSWAHLVLSSEPSTADIRDVKPTFQVGKLRPGKPAGSPTARPGSGRGGQWKPGSLLQRPPPHPCHIRLMSKRLGLRELVCGSPELPQSAWLSPRCCPSRASACPLTTPRCAPGGGGGGRQSGSCQTPEGRGLYCLKEQLGGPWSKPLSSASLSCAVSLPGPQAFHLQNGHSTRAFFT